MPVTSGGLTASLRTRTVGFSFNDRKALERRVLYYKIIIIIINKRGNSDPSKPTIEYITIF